MRPLTKNIATLFIPLFFASQTAFAATNVDLTDIAGHENQTAIEYLYEQGVIRGYGDKTFQPDRAVNRAELLKILIEGKKITPEPAQNQNCFPDVEDQWFAPYVCYAKTQGWVEGYPDGSFKPEQTVNTVEAIKMVVNSREYAVPEMVSGAWYAPYVKVAKEKNLIETEDKAVQTGMEMDRGEISDIMYRAMIIAEQRLSEYVPPELERSTQKINDEHEKTIKRHEKYLTFTDLAPLNPDNPHVWTNAVNNHGQIVGYSMPVNGRRGHPVLWKNGIVKDLGFLPGGDGGSAMNINDKGEIVGYSTVSLVENDHEHLFYFTNGAMQDLKITGQNVAINNNGSIAGIMIVKHAYGQGFYLKDGKTIKLPFEPYAMNDREQIIGWLYGKDNIRHGVLWDNGKITELNMLPMDINNRGQIVGYRDTEQGAQAFLWEDGGLYDLGMIGVPRAINNHGQIVGGHSGLSFLWDKGRVIDLDNMYPHGSEKYVGEVVDINDYGQILGIETLITLPETLPDKDMPAPQIKEEIKPQQTIKE